MGGESNEKDTERGDDKRVEDRDNHSQNEVEEKEEGVDMTEERKGGKTLTSHQIQPRKIEVESKNRGEGKEKNTERGY